jgi:polar amino acid transport system substrate-binding protein
MKWVSLLLLASSAALGAGHVAATTLAQVRERGFLVAGIVAEPSPFGGVAEGKASGFDGALIDGFGKSVPIEIRQRPIAPDELEDALRSGKVDIVTSSVEITAPGQDAVSFTTPVAEATRYYLKRKGDDRIRTIADLAGRRFGTRTSSASLLELTEFEHRLAKAGGALGEPVEYQTYAEAAKALVDKQIDYIVGDIVDLQMAMSDDPSDLEIGDAVSQRTYVAWVTAKDSPEIAGLVSGFLDQQRKSGALAALQQKYLGRPFPDLPETVAAKDWWAARDKPKVFPIPSTKDPD